MHTSKEAEEGFYRNLTAPPAYSECTLLPFCTLVGQPYFLRHFPTGPSLPACIMSLMITWYWNRYLSLLRLLWRGALMNMPHVTGYA